MLYSQDYEPLLKSQYPWQTNDQINVLRRIGSQRFLLIFTQTFQTDRHEAAILTKDRKQSSDIEDHTVLDSAVPFGTASLSAGLFKNGTSTLKVSLQNLVSINKKLGSGPYHEVLMKKKRDTLEVQCSSLHRSKDSLEKKLYNMFSVRKKREIRD